MKKYKTNIDIISLVREKTDIPRVQIKSSLDINQYARKLIDFDITIEERFYIVLLNNSLNTIGYQELSKGGITGTLVDIRILIKLCISALATGCILFHNHPSGKLKASISDKNLTIKVKKALQVFDIKLVDHLIICENNKYLSFSDDGLL